METMNFFSGIAALNITGDLHIIICRGEKTPWVVSVMLHNEQCGDKARKLIMPLNLKGTAEEIDNGFFEQVAAPIQAASGLMVNMEAFMKQLEQAKKQSAMEREKVDKEKKDKEVKDKAYKDAMQKVDELEKQGKYRDAWVKVPDTAAYPEQAEALRKRKSALAAKFAPDLFGAGHAPATSPIQGNKKHQPADDNEETTTDYGDGDMEEDTEQDDNE